jgi:glutamine amidotransferase
MPSVSVINCGVGNLFSIRTALEREGLTVRIVQDMDGEKETDAIVLPGVGSFREASRKIPHTPLLEWVGRGRPLLGICLGLQLFFERSEEGAGRGLALLPGEVRRLPDSVKVPHMGWNRLNVRVEGGLLEGVPDGSWVYFVHSFYPATEGRWVSSTTDYGVRFCSTVEWKSAVGMQFHPEKSGSAGRTILRNFVRMVKR